MSVANQKVVRIHKPKYQRDFLQIGIDEWQDAKRTLNYSEFSLYLYLAGNADNYKLELSQKAVENAIGIKKTAYHDAVNKLKEFGYLTEAYGNTFDFHTRAVRPSGQGIVESEIRPNEQRNPPPRIAPAARKENEVRSGNREIDKINNQIDKTNMSVQQNRKVKDVNEKAIEAYLMPLSDKRKREFELLARELDESSEWIRKAIEFISVADWEKQGFGSLTTPHFIFIIDDLIEEEQKLKSKAQTTTNNSFNTIGG